MTNGEGILTKDLTVEVIAKNTEAAEPAEDEEE